MRDGIVSLKMVEGILFQAILSWVIQSYQHLQVFFTLHLNLQRKWHLSVMTLHPGVVEALLARERPRCVGSFYLEAPLTRETAREPEVVEQRADSNDFRVVSYALQLSEPGREQPGSDSMVEEKRFGMFRA